jgi:hypothetical protein
MPHCAKMLIFAVLKFKEMKLIARLSKLLLIATIALAACQSAPKTDLERIDDLKKQVQADAKTMDELATKDFVQIEKDFFACDSMLQYMQPEEIDEVFQQLQLVDAYINQFKQTRPIMQADMDSTLLQLDNLKADIKTHYLSDSLAAVYLDSETQHVTLLNNQVEYFKDRLGSCKNDLKNIKKKK